ncbi:MAG: tRNA(adenine34) deaminase [Alteromonas naphthalenivorans]|jgi:tRNA(adenine34) deaminase
MNKSHEHYMDQALELAQKAFDAGEVPIGAVVVDQDGNVIGSSFNSVECDLTQTAHAELKALQKASQNKKNWRLVDCTLYVTLEPCSMCFSASKLSRIKALYYAASSPLFGFRLDKDCFLSLYNNDDLFIKGGIREDESKQILKQFFKKKRNKGDQNKGRTK